MLPNKVLQLDYEDISHLVEKHIDDITHFEQSNNIKFDSILAKLRNGTVSGSIIANRFQLSMSVIEMPRNINIENFRIFFSYDIEEKLKLGKTVNILFVDGICGTGKTLDYLKTFISHHPLKSQINIITYCTFVDSNAKTKPDIIGLEVQDRFFQPPWEWRSFTPQAHLDRLEIGDIKASNEQEYCVGFSSSETFSLVEDLFGANPKFDWTMVFSEPEGKTITSSGISSFENIPVKLNLSEAMTKYKSLIDQKQNFIEQNGLTHFIEEDINQALLIAEKCPVCHVIYIDDNNLFRIFAKKTTSKDFHI